MQATLEKFPEVNLSLGNAREFWYVVEGAFKAGAPAGLFDFGVGPRGCRSLVAKEASYCSNERTCSQLATAVVTVRSTGYNRPAVPLRATMDDLRQPLEVVRDDQESTEEESVFRANLADEAAVNEWLEAYSIRTNTSWIVWNFRRAGKRYVTFRVAFVVLGSLKHCSHGIRCIAANAIII